MTEMLLTLQRIDVAGLFVFGHDAGRTIVARGLLVRRWLMRTAFIDKLLPAGRLTLGNRFPGWCHAVFFTACHRAFPVFRGSGERTAPWRGLSPTGSRSAARPVGNEAIGSAARSVRGCSTEADAEGAKGDLFGREGHTLKARQ